MVKLKTNQILTFLIVLLTFSFLLLTSATNAFAHVLETDGNIGAILHVNPNDDPAALEPASFFFEFKDKSGQFNPSRCDCRVSITEAGKTIFSTGLFDVNSNSSLTS